MVTFLSGGTGTPKLLDGVAATYSPEEITVVANTGDDIELGGLLVCPDVDTLLYQGAGVLDRNRWWGIKGDTGRTHEALRNIGSSMGIPTEPRYLPEDRQLAGRHLARWRRFSGASEFMQIGDRDRAVHITRTSLLDDGLRLTEAIEELADGFGLAVDLLPMSDDPVATMVHTPDGEIHFQEFWVAEGGEPAVDNVEFRGSAEAQPTGEVLDALADDVVIGPSNPVTSIGPMLALDGVAEGLWETPVVVVSPFDADGAYSGPAEKLMDAIGATPNAAGLSQAYPFADAFVLDESDDATLDRPVVRTDISIDGREDAARVMRAVEAARREVT